MSNMTAEPDSPPTSRYAAPLTVLLRPVMLLAQLTARMWLAIARAPWATVFFAVLFVVGLFSWAFRVFAEQDSAATLPVFLAAGATYLGALGILSAVWAGRRTFSVTLLLAPIALAAYTAVVLGWVAYSSPGALQIGAWPKAQLIALLFLGYTDPFVLPWFSDAAQSNLVLAQRFAVGTTIAVLLLPVAGLVSRRLAAVRSRFDRQLDVVVGSGPEAADLALALAEEDRTTASWMALSLRNPAARMGDIDRVSQRTRRVVFVDDGLAKTPLRRMTQRGIAVLSDDDRAREHVARLVAHRPMLWRNLIDCFRLRTLVPPRRVRLDRLYLVSTDPGVVDRCFQAAREVLYQVAAEHTVFVRDVDSDISPDAKTDADANAVTKDSSAVTKDSSAVTKDACQSSAG